MVRLQKCVPWSLMMARGIPNLQKIFDLTKSATTLESLVRVVLLQPTLKHNQQQVKCKENQKKQGKGP